MANETECARVVKRRVEHLKEANDPASRLGWERKRLDRLLTDYLLREGCYDTARRVGWWRDTANRLPAKQLMNDQ